MTTSKAGFSPPPQRGMIRVGPLSAIPSILREFCVDPDRLLKDFGLAESIFANPDNTIVYRTAGSLFKACVRVTACAHFGLLVGQRSDASGLGAAGFLLRNAPDVITALNDLVANFDLHNRGATPFLEVSSETAILGYEIYDQGVEGADQIGDGALAVGWNILRALCGPEWLPVEVHFRHQPPADAGAFRRFFQAPLRFNAARNALVFRSSFLGKKVGGADPLLRHHFQQHVAEMRRYSHQDFHDQAYRALLLLIGSHRCALEDLAGHFALHPRTLNRRLKDGGTSFRELHNRARHETARQLLRDTTSSIEAIATLLGFSGSSAFNRAFSRWEGVPPATWQKRGAG